MKNVVIYLRISTSNQDFESQLNSLTDYCNRNKYNIVQIFQEQISGYITERDQLTECLNFVKDKSNNCHTLMCWEISRLGRRLKDVLNVAYDLTENKINLYIYKDNINTLNDDGSENTQGSMYMQILGMFAENERKLIVSRFQRGRYSAVKNNNRFGGGKLIPYGYRKEDKKIIIDEYESGIIKKIYQLYLDGNGSGKIAKYLIDNDIPTKMKLTFPEKNIKNNWLDKTILNILQNPIYTGRMEYKIDENNKKPVYEIFERPELRIIDDEVFTKVSSIIKSKSNSNGIHKKFQLLLDGIPVICGYCGKTYYSHKSKDGNTNAYKCISRRHNNEFCGNYGIGIDKLNSSIYYILRRTAQMKQKLESDLQNDSITIKIDQLTIKIEEYNKLLTKINNGEKMLVNQLIKGNINESIYESNYKEIQKDKQSIEKEINNITIQIEQLTELNKRKYSINEYLRNLKTSSNNLKELYNTLVQKVVIYTAKQNYLSSIGNDFNHFIEIYLYTNDHPINLLVSQRTNKIVSLPQNLFDKKTMILKSTKNLNIIEYEPPFNYDKLVGN